MTAHNDPTAVDPATLMEDVADLRATVNELAAQLQDTTARVGFVLDRETVGEAGQEEPEPGQVSGQATGESEGKPPAPPLILRLPAHEFETELTALDAWVKHVLAPNYLNEVTSQAPWCARWWEHPQAVARLHALWVAWQELTTPEAGGWTGPSVWHRDHLDPPA